MKSYTTFQIGKKKYLVDYLKFGYFTPVDRPGVGSVENYKPEDGILYGYTTVFVTIPEASIGNLKIKYHWDGKMYKAKSAAFSEAEPPSPNNRDRGSGTAAHY